MAAVLAATTSSERRFVSMPLGDAPPPDDAPRRVWEVEPGALFIAVGVLIERSELEQVLLDVAQQDRRRAREDVLLHDAVRECARPSRFAEAVERLLDTRTQCVQRRAGACSLYELAAWWLDAKERLGGRHLTALLWSLARDRRWIVRPLSDMLRGDIWVRALRLLGEAPARSTP